MILRILAILSSVAALIFHGILTWEHYATRLGTVTGIGFCKMGALFNCATVAASAYSQLILGIPNAVLGFWTNLLFLIFLSWSLVELFFFQRENPFAILMTRLLSYLILLASVVMALISAIILKHFCLFCVLAYVTSLIQFFTVWRMFPQSISWRQLSWKPTLITFVILGALSLFTKEIIVRELGGDRLNYAIQESIATWKNAPSYAFSLEHSIIYSQKDENAPTLVEFVDPFCPFCKLASENLKAFFQTRPNVTLLIKLFPLDGHCNPHINQKSEDPKRCLWSRWLICLAEHKAGAQAIDWLFEHQAQLARQSFEEGIIQFYQTNLANVTPDTIKSCLDLDSTQQKLQKMIEEGHQAQIKGTPTIFLNNKVLTGGHLPIILEKVLPLVNR